MSVRLLLKTQTKAVSHLIDAQKLELMRETNSDQEQ